MGGAEGRLAALLLAVAAAGGASGGVARRLPRRGRGLTPAPLQDALGSLCREGRPHRATRRRPRGMGGADRARVATIWRGGALYVPSRARAAGRTADRAPQSKDIVGLVGAEELKLPQGNLSALHLDVEAEHAL